MQVLYTIEKTLKNIQVTWENGNVLMVVQNSFFVFSVTFLCDPYRLLYNIDMDADSFESEVKLSGGVKDYTFNFGNLSISGTDFQEVEPDRFVI